MIERHSNYERILTGTGALYGEFVTDSIERVSQVLRMVCVDGAINNATVEAHVYTPQGHQLISLYDQPILQRNLADSKVLIDLKPIFDQSQITKGTFKVGINITNNLVGSYNNPSLRVQEISPDRDEIHVRLHPKFKQLAELSQVYTTLNNAKTEGVLRTISVNFGKNRLYGLIGVWFDTQDPQSLYLKFDQPINEELLQSDECWICYEITDTYYDTVTLTREVKQIEGPQLRQPNFDAGSMLVDSKATTFKTWDDLLDSDLPSSEALIRKALGNQAQSVKLNIDFTHLHTHIFYSTARQRFEIFIEKLTQLERYYGELDALNDTTATGSIQVRSNKEIVSSRIERVLEGFDAFEQWLYEDSNPNIFTHDIQGPITPYPKEDGECVLVESTEAVEWLQSMLQYSDEYDRDNINRLWWSIPEHVLMQAGSSDYVLFVEMVATHFDNIHAYVKALTQIHDRDEHPQRGTSSELLQHVAKSYGWNVQDVRQLSSVWLYKIGEESEDFETLSHEQQTKQVWKRTVNSLPFLLKTKGTTRSIKALMNIYGIPQTLLSIKEYGGPGIEGNKPSQVEQRFSYALLFENNAHVSFERAPIELNREEEYTWEHSGSYYANANTIEFRFKAREKDAVQTLWALTDDSGSLKAQVLLRPYEDVYSGSLNYGTVEFHADSQVVVSDLLPLFNNDPWTIALINSHTFTDSDTSGSITLKVASAKDYALGEVVHFSEIDWEYSGSIASLLGYSTKEIENPYTIYLGNSQVVGTFPYSGSLQAYKEYFTPYSQETFENHVLNPASYTVDEPLAVFDEMYRYFPLGIDVQRWDHTTELERPSSHPDQSRQHTITFASFSMGQSEQYENIKETYFIYAPTLGGQSLRSNKIRLESNSDIDQLSPTIKRSVGSYDRSQFDSNRLAVVFSLADQINRDIFNHLGFSELDSLIGGAHNEFESVYSELRRYRGQYFKKYVQINNVNSFIDVLSLYDYTFFEQIKQLVPGRADLIAGVLIEPHVLERNKVILSKRPKVKNPQYETVIQYPLNQEGEQYYEEGIIEYPTEIDVDYTYKTGSVDFDSTIEVTHTYKTGSVEYDREIDIAHEYRKGSIKQPTKIFGCITEGRTQTGDLQGFVEGVAQVPLPKFIGSSGSLEPVIDQTYIQNNSPYSIIEVNQTTSSLKQTGYQHNENGSENNKRFTGSKLSGAGFNIDSPETSDGGPVVEVWENNEPIISITDNDPLGNIRVQG